LQEETFPGLQDAVTALDNDQSDCEVKWERTRLYELGAWDFLGFAQDDLQDDSDRSRSNGISNAKRAVACRVDEILTLSYLRPFMARERWGLPYKLEVIKKLDCPGPYVLRGYISDQRNVLEHEYRKPPDPDAVRYVADVTELFLRATDDYVAAGWMISASVSVRAEEQRRSEPGKEMSTVGKETYSMEFDHVDERINVTYAQSVEASVFRRRSGWMESTETALKDPVARDVRLTDCDKELLVDLARLLRKKARR